MARIRQLHPHNYGNPENTSQDFENICRYLNAAELGNLTIAELLRILFDANGNFVGPVQMRVDPVYGLQYRVGTYTTNGVADADKGWVTLVELDDIRGNDGSSCGQIQAPWTSTRYDVLADDSQVKIDFELQAGDSVLVFLNGWLMVEGAGNDYVLDFITSPTGVIFNTPLQENDKVTLYRIYDAENSGYRREDLELTSSQSTFIFEYNNLENLQVYHDGILQAEGPSQDYVLDPTNNLILFTRVLQAGDRVSIIVVENRNSAHVAGLMLEASYTDPATGMILGTKVAFEDESISPAKVSSLSDLMQIAATAVSSQSTPSSPEPLFWIDESESPPVVKFWTGTQYIPVSGDVNIPSYLTTDRYRVLQIDGTGTKLQWGFVDLSGVVKTTEKGAAYGIATLDASGRLEQSQLPQPRNRRTVWMLNAGAISDTEYLMHRYFMEKVQVVGFAGRLNAGTCTAQITVNGVGYGSTFSLGVPQNETVIGSPIVIDAKSQSASLGVEITNAASAEDLDVALVIETLE